jgi:hypothetical protein
MYRKSVFLIVLLAAGTVLVALSYLRSSRHKSETSSPGSKKTESRVTSCKKSPVPSVTTQKLVAENAVGSGKTNRDSPVPLPADEVRERKPQTTDSEPPAEHGSAVSGKQKEQVLLHLKDPQVPIEQRQRKIEELARRGDTEAVEILKRLGDERTHLNAAAVKALGRMDQPEIAAYLRGKLTDRNPRIIAAAVDGLARIDGDNAVPVIVKTLNQNHSRADGFQDVVCRACVESLGSIGSPEAVPALAKELEEQVGKSFQYDYGSEVVAALREIGHPSGRQALISYISKLESKKEKMKEHPMPRRYLAKKVEEAREAAQYLKENT